MTYSVQIVVVFKISPEPFRVVVLIFLHCKFSDNKWNYQIFLVKRCKINNVVAHILHR